MLPQFNLVQEILGNSVSSVKSFDNFEDSNLNVSQKDAVSKASCRDPAGFSLIQGPPGTGKTQTIVAIIKRLLDTSSDDVIIEDNGQRTSGWKAKKMKEKLIHSRKHILVCAPSNAAVDELTVRLRSLIPENWERDQKGLQYIIRYGSGVDEKSAAAKFSLEKILEKEMDARQLSRSDDKEIESIELELNRLQSRITSLTSSKGADINELSKLKERKVSLLCKKKDISSKSRANRFEKVEALKNRRIELLSNARIVCSTLSACGTDVFKTIDHGFETVVIDESTQAVELTTLIPLQFQCRRCILVGDPQQLPATVISRAAADHSYSRSLFERLLHNCRDFSMLRVQYRMHPEIRLFPSSFFYNNELEDAFHETSRHFRKDFYNDPILKPYSFFDIVGEESTYKKSFKNREEASFCCDLTEYILKAVPKCSIGIIAPYQEQVREVKKLLRERIKMSQYDLSVSSVDGFQGQEKDFVIFSCVRAHRDSSSKKGKFNIGFLSDLRRLNVGITRAKFCMFIIGCGEILESDESWRKLIENAKDRNRFIRLPSNNPRSYLLNPPRSSHSNSHNYRRSSPEADPPGFVKLKKRKHH
jgi:senataxin